MKPRAGHTLVELLLAMSLFMLALVLCGRLAVLGMRSRSDGMERNSEFRRIITTFHQLQQDVHQLRRLYAPDLSDFGVRRPGQDSRAFVFSTHASDGSLQVIGWSLREQELARTVYRPDFDPAVPASQIPQDRARQLSSGGIADFRLQQQPPGANFGSRLLTVEVVCAPPLQHRLLTTLSPENL